MVDKKKNNINKQCIKRKKKKNISFSINNNTGGIIFTYLSLYFIILLTNDIQHTPPCPIGKQNANKQFGLYLVVFFNQYIYKFQFPN